MEINRLDLPRRSVGEGPVWDVAEQALYYIDILEQRVLRWDPVSGEQREWPVPDMIGSMALREKGGAIVALVGGVHSLDFDSGVVAPLALFEPANPQIQLADGKVDRAGRFVFGTSHRKAAEPVGGLFSLGPDGAIAQLDSGLTLGTGRASRPTIARSTTPTAWRTRSMPTITILARAPLPTGAHSSKRAVTAPSPTGRPWIPAAISGSPSARAEWCCASRQRARWSA